MNSLQGSYVQTLDRIFPKQTLCLVFFRFGDLIAASYTETIFKFSASAEFNQTYTKKREKWNMPKIRIAFSWPYSYLWNGDSPAVFPWHDLELELQNALRTHAHETSEPLDRQTDGRTDGRTDEDERGEVIVPQLNGCLALTTILSKVLIISWGMSAEMTEPPPPTRPQPKKDICQRHRLITGVTKLHSN